MWDTGHIVTSNYIGIGVTQCTSLQPTAIKRIT